MSMWKVVRTELKEARRMMPDKRKDIWRDHASWSMVGSKWVERSERMRFMGSVLEDDVNAVGSAEGKKLRLKAARVVAKMR